MIPKTEIRDGALFCSLDAADLGLPIRTTMCHAPIPYGGIWEQIGQAFQEQAKATCPVDTGYLRAHIGYGSDKKGVDMWSDAPYSAYQEYGTYKMRAQPYFEAAIANAVQQYESVMWAMADEWMEMDADLFFLTDRCGREGSLEECYADLARLDRIIAFMERENATTIAEAGWYYDLTNLYDARAEIEARIQELKEIEAARQAQAQGLGGFIAEIFGMILAELIMAPLTMFEIIFDDMWGGCDTEHHSDH